MPLLQFRSFSIHRSINMQLQFPPSYPPRYLLQSLSSRMLPTNFGFIFPVYICQPNWQIEFVRTGTSSSMIYIEKCGNALLCTGWWLRSFFNSNKPNLAPMSHTSTRRRHAHFWRQVRCWQFVSYFFHVFGFSFRFYLLHHVPQRRTFSWAYHFLKDFVYCHLTCWA